MKILIVVIGTLAVLGIAIFYFVNKSDQGGEFRIDYAKLEKLAENHPRGQEYLARIREREQALFDEDETKVREAYELIAFDMRQLGDNEGSILGYRASLSLFENNIFSWNNLAVSYEEIGEYKKAEAAYKKIMELSPGDVPNYRKLADLYLYHLTEKEDQIPVIMEKGLSHVPDHPDFLSYLAVYWKNRGEKEKAIGYYERLLRIVPGNKSAVLDLNELLR